ncbi:MAG: hypothetical protein ACRD2P_07330 [Terriglobia bacterium]
MNAARQRLRYSDAAQLAQAVTNVLDQSFKEPCRAYIPAFFFHLVKPAKFQPPRRRAPSGVIPVAT